MPSTRASAHPRVFWAAAGRAVGSSEPPRESCRAVTASTPTTSTATTPTTSRRSRRALGGALVTSQVLADQRVGVDLQQAGPLGHRHRRDGAVGHGGGGLAVLRLP